MIFFGCHFLCLRSSREKRQLYQQPVGSSGVLNDEDHGCEGVQLRCRFDNLLECVLLAAVQLYSELRSAVSVEQS
jgi:hypothetical protein